MSVGYNSTSIVDFLSLGTSPGGVLIMPSVILHAVFDESGKFQDHDAISLCGWINNLAGWDTFALRWKRVLNQFDMKELHTTEFMGLYGQYSELGGKWGEERDQKKFEALSMFVEVIRDYVERGLGAAIDSKHFRSMPQQDRKIIGADPYFIAFQEILLQAVNHAQFYSQRTGIEDVAVGLVFDQDERQEIECIKIFNEIKKIRPEVRKTFTGICFADRRTYEPLQAADLIAYVTRQEFDRRQHHPDWPISPWFDALSARNRNYIIDGLFNARIFDAQCLNELVADVRKRKDNVKQ
jgi:hypothetical protein